MGGGVLLVVWASSEEVSENVLESERKPAEMGSDCVECEDGKAEIVDELEEPNRKAASIATELTRAAQMLVSPPPGDGPPFSEGEVRSGMQ
jgi:hypothetical protein